MQCGSGGTLCEWDHEKGLHHLQERDVGLALRDLLLLLLKHLVMVVGGVETEQVLGVGEGVFGRSVYHFEVASDSHLHFIQVYDCKAILEHDLILLLCRLDGYNLPELFKIVNATLRVKK